MECKNCYSDDVIKYGHGRQWSQRMLCNHCCSTFTSVGIRWTYEKAFIENIVHQYRHEHKKAKDILENYKISSRTLIKRSKEIHNADCPFCK
jgi:transposase-like protein